MLIRLTLRSFILSAAAIFIILLFSVSPASAELKRIIVIETMPVPVVLEHSLAFMAGMEELGYKNGENAEFLMIKAKGDKARAVSLLEKAVAEKKPDLVVTFATLASQAAHQVLKNSKVPIVFSVVSDPIGAGLIKEVGRPTGTNITGRIYTLFRETKVKLLMRLLKQKHGSNTIRLGVIHSDYPSSKGDIKTLKKIASQMEGVEFINYEFPYRKMPAGLDDMLAEYAKGISELEDKVDYWFQVSGPLGEVEDTIKVLVKAGKLPTAYGNTLRAVELGALMTVNPNFEEGGKEAARLAQKVLQGTDPGTIPVLAPENFDLGINLTTAMKLGIAVPSDMMTMAEGHIYR